MNSDCYFKIGHTHDICEDFAIANNNDQPFAVLSDGCSGSPRTDFGARFLALAMEDVLSSKLTKEETNTMHMMGLTIARMISTASGLNDQCLDATLGYVFADDTHFKAFLAGDGAIAALSKDGKKWASVIEYPSGAPPYLSYSLNEERLKRFMKATNGCRHFVHTYKWTDVNTVTNETVEGHGMNTHAFAFPRDEYDLVMVMSDGVCSFQQPINSETTKYFEQADPIKIIDKFLAVKSPTGDFIKRRCKRAIKNLCTKNGWKHLDDISVAAIHANEKM